MSSPPSSSSSYLEPTASAVIDVTSTFSPHHGTPRKSKPAIQVRLESSPRKVSTPDQLKERIDKASQRKQENESAKVDKARANLTKAFQRAAETKAREKENTVEVPGEEIKRLHAELLEVSKLHTKLVFGDEPAPITDADVGESSTSSSSTTTTTATAAADQDSA